MKTWWLSFADGTLPTGQQFLGACIVDATDLASAVSISHRVGVNPGGEVKIGALPFPVADGYKNRLFDKEEATRISTMSPTEMMAS